MGSASDRPDLLARSMRTSWIMALALFALLLPGSAAAAVSLAAGQCIMAASFFTLERLVKLFTEQGRGTRELPMLGWGAAKLAVVYGGAFALTRWQPLEFLPLVLGLSLPLIAILLKAIMLALGFGPSTLKRRATPTAGPAGSAAKPAALLLLLAALALSAGGPARAADPPPAPPSAPAQGAEAVAAQAHDSAGAAATHDAAAGSEHGAGAGAEHGAAAGHGEGGEEHDGGQHLPNWVVMLHGYFPGFAPVTWLYQNQVLFFAWLAGIVFFLFSWIAMRNHTLVPRPLQNALEWIVESMEEVTSGMLGKFNDRYFPYIMAVFFYILTMNLLGIVPGMKSSTGVLDVTLALAVVTFLYVQWSGIRNLGPLGYLDHLAGSPRDVIGFAMLPIMIPVHVLGELAKPVSLSCRLFGNIFGEDTLVAVFVTSAALCLKASLIVIGAPPLFGITALFMLLQTLTSIVQALIFSLLTTVYLYMMLPHDAHGHGEAGHEHAHAH